MWGLVAIEQVPIVQTVNKYVNVLDQFFTHTHKDTTTQYGLKVSVRHPHLHQPPCRSYIKMSLIRAKSSAPKYDVLRQLLWPGPVTKRIRFPCIPCLSCNSPSDNARRSLISLCRPDGANQQVMLRVCLNLVQQTNPAFKLQGSWY